MSQTPLRASQVAPVVKNLPANAGTTRDASSIPGSGRSPGVGNGSLFQYACLENSTDRGAWWIAVQGAQSETTEQLSVRAHTRT